jgi:hypothetical protein
MEITIITNVTDGDGEWQSSYQMTGESFMDMATEKFSGKEICDMIHNGHDETIETLTSMIRCNEMNESNTDAGYNGVPDCWRTKHKWMHIEPMTPGGGVWDICYECKTVRHTFWTNPTLNKRIVTFTYPNGKVRTVRMKGGGHVVGWARR